MPSGSSWSSLPTTYLPGRRRCCWRVSSPARARSGFATASFTSRLGLRSQDAAPGCACRRAGRGRGSSRLPLASSGTSPPPRADAPPRPARPRQPSGAWRPAKPARNRHLTAAASARLRLSAISATHTMTATPPVGSLTYFFGLAARFGLVPGEDRRRARGLSGNDRRRGCGHLAGRHLPGSQMV